MGISPKYAFSWPFFSVKSRFHPFLSQKLAFSCYFSTKDFFTWLFSLKFAFPCPYPTKILIFMHFFALNSAFLCIFPQKFAFLCIFPQAYPLVCTFSTKIRVDIPFFHWNTHVHALIQVNGTFNKWTTDDFIPGYLPDRNVEDDTVCEASKYLKICSFSIAATEKTPCLVLKYQNRW